MVVISLDKKRIGSDESVCVSIKLGITRVIESNFIRYEYLYT